MFGFNDLWNVKAWFRFRHNYCTKLWTSNKTEKLLVINFGLITAKKWKKLYQSIKHWAWVKEIPKSQIDLVWIIFILIVTYGGDVWKSGGGYKQAK